MFILFVEMPKENSDVIFFIVVDMFEKEVFFLWKKCFQCVKTEGA